MSFIFVVKGFALTYNLKAGGTYTNPAHWGTDATGTVGSPASFAGANNWNFTSNNANVVLNAPWSLPVNAIVNFGNGTTAFNAIITASNVFNSGSQPTLKVKNNCTLTVQADQNFSTNPLKTQFLIGSVCEYALGSTRIQGLSINSLLLSTDIEILNNALLTATNVIIGAGVTFSVINDATITITGTISGSGNFYGDASSNTTIKLTGTGNVGNISFRNDNMLANLNLSLGSSSSSVNLASDFYPNNGSLTLASGIFNIGSNVVALDAINLAITGGSFATTSTSTLIIGLGSGVISSGSLLFASTSNTIGVLEVNNTGFNISLGSPLYIYERVAVLDGTLTSGGNLNITASNGHYGYVDQVGTSGAIAGNVVVNSFFPSGNTGWCLLGANGVTGQTINDMQNKFFVTCQDCTYDPSAAGNFTSVQGYDETSCTYVTNTSTASSLSPGVGYWVYLGTTSGVSANMTWNYTGPIQQGPLTLNTTASGACGNQGFNLVANPYPSPISWTNLYNLSANSMNFNDVVYTYKRSGVAATFQSGGASTGGGTDEIPPGQGFFVQNIIFSPATLDFDEAVKTTNNTTNLSKGASTLSQKNAFRLNVLGSYDHDDAVFQVRPNTSFYRDKHGDALKLFSNPNGIYNPKYTSISSKDPNGEDLAINSFPSASTTMTIPLLVKVSSNGSYTLHASEFDNYESCIVIKDKLTGVLTDLKVKAYVSNIKDTTSTPRFELLVCANGAGPVSVKEFFASSNISINHDAEGVLVKTNYSDDTKSIVSAYNLIGQKIMDDVTMEGKQSLRLPINDKQQVVLIKVVNDKENLTKKVLMD